MSKILFFSENIDFNISNKKEVSEWLRSIAKSELRNIGDLNIVFLSDEELLMMNKKFLLHDYYTDIITFPTDGDKVSGEMYISIDRVSENAAKVKINFIDELHRVIAHGLLHLLNYDDKSQGQQEEMRAKEEFCLSLRNFNVPRETK